jgi:hypothetical protein
MSHLGYDVCRDLGTTFKELDSNNLMKNTKLFRECGAENSKRIVGVSAEDEANYVGRAEGPAAGVAAELRRIDPSGLRQVSGRFGGR